MTSARGLSMSLTATPATLSTSGLASASLTDGIRVSTESVTIPTQISSARVSWTTGLATAHPLIITE